MTTDHEYYEDDIHLMAILSEEDKCYYKFLNSVKALNIPTIGEATAKDIFKYLERAYDETTMDFFNEEVKNLPNKFETISELSANTLFSA